MNDEDKLVCFIDLLGTKESSRISSDDYHQAIKEFHEALNNAKGHLSESYQIKGFSDCAFLALNPDNNSIAFLNDIREHLFAKSYYFKCSIVYGEFNVEVQNDEGFSSTTFGEKSVAAYEKHEDYKGIGYVVDEAVYTNKEIGEIESQFVRSFYLRKTKPVEFVPCFDVRFDDRFIGTTKFLEDKKENKIKKGSSNHSSEGNINLYLKNFVIAKTKNKNYAKYYIPTIISIINSSDFSKIAFSKENGWNGVTMIFYKIFFDSVFQKRITSIPGGEIIYFAALEKFYTDMEYVDEERGEKDEVRTQLAEIISGKQKIKNFISKVPDFIFQKKYLQDFIERLAKIELKEVNIFK